MWHGTVCFNLLLYIKKKKLFQRFIPGYYQLIHSRTKYSGFKRETEAKSPQLLVSWQRRPRCNFRSIAYPKPHHASPGPEPLHAHPLALVGSCPRPCPQLVCSLLSLTRGLLLEGQGFQGIDGPQSQLRSLHGLPLSVYTGGHISNPKCTLSEASIGLPLSVYTIGHNSNPVHTLSEASTAFLSVSTLGVTSPSLGTLSQKPPRPSSQCLHCVSQLQPHAHFCIFPESPQDSDLKKGST